MTLAERGRENLAVSVRPRVVVDASVLIAGLTEGDQGTETAREVVGLIKTGKIELCVTHEVKRDVRLGAAKAGKKGVLTPEQILELEQILTVATDVTSNLLEVAVPSVVADNTDTKYYQAVVKAGAAALISADRHLLEDPMRQMYGVTNPFGFLRSIGK